MEGAGRRRAQGTVVFGVAPILMMLRSNAGPIAQRIRRLSYAGVSRVSIFAAKGVGIQGEALEDTGGSRP